MQPPVDPVEQRSNIVLDRNKTRPNSRNKATAFCVFMIGLLCRMDDRGVRFVKIDAFAVEERAASNDARILQCEPRVDSRHASNHSEQR